MNSLSDMQTTSTSTRESETSSSEGGSFIIDSTAFYENLNFHRMRSNVMVSTVYKSAKTKMCNKYRKHWQSYVSCQQSGQTRSFLTLLKFFVQSTLLDIWKCHKLLSHTIFEYIFFSSYFVVIFCLRSSSIGGCLYLLQLYTLL